MTTILLGAGGENQGMLRQQAFLSPDGTVVPVSTSTQKIWRDTFAGAAVDASKWTVTQVTGTGISTAVSVGQLTVSMGTTSGDELWLVSNEVFQSPFRAMFGLSMSQRIAGNLVYVEAVSVDPVTLAINEANAMAWRFDGTTATNAIYEVQEAALARLSSSASTVVTTAAQSVIELELFNDEVYFHSRAIDSTVARANSYVRQTQVPDPNALYRIRLRFKNTAAPASNTSVVFALAHVNDHQEMIAEISAGRGSSAAGQALSTFVSGGALGANALVVQGTGNNSTSVAPLAIGTAFSALPATYTTTRTAGLSLTLAGSAITKPYSIPESDWSYASAAGGIVNTTDVVAKALNATLRNYVTGLSVINTSTTATEFVVKDGATVLWRVMLPASMLVAMNVVFLSPLRGTANTAINLACITTGAAVYANLQGFTAP